jgi:hypothetical protein
MNDHAKLRDALSRLAAEAPHNVSQSAEDRMLAAFRARRAGPRRMWMYGVAAAACFIFALTWLVTHPSPQALRTPSLSVDSYERVPAGFVPLPYAESDVPLEEAVIVRVELQRSQLGRLGIPVSAPAIDGRVSADLLVGQDGVTRAVRLVQ